MKILAKGLIGLFIIFAPFTVSLKNRSNHGAADGAEFVKGFAGLEFKHLTAGAKACCCDLDCGGGTCIGAGYVYVCNAGGSLCDWPGTCW
jgi:hypothetical protein